MIYTKEHLLQFLSTCPLRRCVMRALANGQVEVLGGFSAIPPGSGPGFIVQLTAQTGTVYYVAVQFRLCGVEYARVIPEVPWANWDGKVGRNSLYEGAKPSEYYRRRAAAKSARSVEVDSGNLLP